MSSQTLIVWWTDGPPKGAHRVDDRHYVMKHKRRHYVLWRQRWVVVADGYEHVIDHLDEWLRNEKHGIEWARA